MPDSDAETELESDSDAETELESHSDAETELESIIDSNDVKKDESIQVKHYNSTCPVCTNSMSDIQKEGGQILTLSCKHSICLSPCADKWSRINNSCPICKAPMNLNLKQPTKARLCTMCGEPGHNKTTCVIKEKSVYTFTESQILSQKRERSDRAIDRETARNRH